MLFFLFLEIKVEKEIIQKIHFAILAVIIITSNLFYILLNPINTALAQTVFITAIAPTAIAAPVIISLKKGEVEFVTFSLLLNNVVVAFLIPFLLPHIISSTHNISVSEVLMPVIITIFVPLVLAQATKYFLPRVWSSMIGWKDFSYYILVLNIYLAVSDASNYIRTELPSNIEIVFIIGAASAFLCFFFFFIGGIIGGSKFKEEAKQSLGQKNNAFTIWISLTFMSPISSLGPIFYVLFQNLYISFELYMIKRKELIL